MSNWEFLFRINAVFELLLIALILIGLVNVDGLKSLIELNFDIFLLVELNFLIWFRDLLGFC